jgi:hypothetical protein
MFAVWLRTIKAGGPSVLYLVHFRGLLVGDARKIVIHAAEFPSLALFSGLVS